MEGISSTPPNTNETVIETDGISRRSFFGLNDGKKPERPTATINKTESTLTDIQRSGLGSAIATAIAKPFVWTGTKAKEKSENILSEHWKVSHLTKKEIKQRRKVENVESEITTLKSQITSIESNKETREKEIEAVRAIRPDSISNAASEGRETATNTVDNAKIANIKTLITAKRTERNSLINKHKETETARNSEISKVLRVYEEKLRPHTDKITNLQTKVNEGAESIATYEKGIGEANNDARKLEQLIPTVTTSEARIRAKNNLDEIYAEIKKGNRTIAKVHKTQIKNANKLKDKTIRSAKLVGKVATWNSKLNEPEQAKGKGGELQTEGTPTTNEQGGLSESNNEVPGGVPRDIPNGISNTDPDTPAPEYVPDNDTTEMAYIMKLTEDLDNHKMRLEQYAQSWNNLNKKNRDFVPFKLDINNIKENLNESPEKTTIKNIEDAILVYAEAHNKNIKITKTIFTLMRLKIKF